MKYQQHRLTRIKPDGSFVETVLWLECDSRVSKGSIVTLEGSNDEWIVAEKYPETLEHKDIKKNWHVGGL